MGTGHICVVIVVHVSTKCTLSRKQGDVIVGKTNGKPGLIAFRVAHASKHGAGVICKKDRGGIFVNVFHVATRKQGAGIVGKRNLM